MGTQANHDQLSADIASLRIVRQAQSPSPARPSWLNAIGLLLAALGLGVALVAHSSSDSRPVVELGEVRLTEPAGAVVDFSAVGHIMPEFRARVGTYLTGRIASVHVREGSRVNAKELLFDLEDADQRSALVIAEVQVRAGRARLEAMQAAQEEPRSLYERQKALADVGAATRSVVEDLARKLSSETARLRAATVEVEVKEAEAAAVRTTLSHTRIVAPIDGVVTTKPPSIGDIVSPGVPLMEIADFASLRVEADVQESRLGQMSPGITVEVVCDALPKQRLRGVVKEVLPRLDRARATGTVRIALLDLPTALLPEMAARVNFLLNSPPAMAAASWVPGVPMLPRIRRGPPWKDFDSPVRAEPLPGTDAQPVQESASKWVPSRAVAQRDGRPVLFTVEGGHVRVVPVELGPARGDEIELRNGPVAGTRVVIAPPANLEDSMPIKERTS